MPSITPTPDLIESILNGINYTGTFKSYVDNGDGTITGQTCDTLHARKLGKITIDSIDYTVQSVVNKTSITFIGSLPVALDFTVAAPFYFHGTPIMINEHLSQIVDDRNKLPMVYLLEVFRETFDLDPESSIDRTSDLSIFFMDIADYANWDTDQHYQNAISPMRNLAESFINAVNNANGVGKIANYTTINHANFGIYFTNQGHQTPIFNEKISGVELQITLPFKKDLTCNCP